MNIKQPLKDLFNIWQESVKSMAYNSMPFLGIIILLIGLSIIQSIIISVFGLHAIFNFVNIFGFARNMSSIFLISFIFQIIGSLFVIATTCYIISSNNSNIFTVHETWNFIRPKLKALTIALILKSILVSILSMFFIIPGTLVYTALLFVEVLIVFENRSALNSFKRSFELSSQNFIPLFLIYLGLFEIPSIFFYSFIFKGILSSLLTIFVYNTYSQNNKIYVIK